MPCIWDLMAQVHSSQESEEKINQFSPPCGQYSIYVKKKIKIFTNNQNKKAFFLISSICINSLSHCPYSSSCLLEKIWSFGAQDLRKFLFLFIVHSHCAFGVVLNFNPHDADNTNSMFKNTFTYISRYSVQSLFINDIDKKCLYEIGRDRQDCSAN